MLSDFGMCADVACALTCRVDWRLGPAEDWVALRHVQTRYLWVEQRVQQGDLRLKKEPGDTNVSDALTKPLDEKRMTNLLTMRGYMFRGGRTELAPEARSDELEVEELYVTEENCKLFLKRQSKLLSAARRGSKNFYETRSDIFPGR